MGFGESEARPPSVLDGGSADTETHGAREGAETSVRNVQAEPDSGAGDDQVSQDTAKQVHDAFKRIMESAAGDERIGKRLALADICLQVHFTDAEDLSLTLLLDRDPIEVCDGAEGDPDVELWASAADVLRFWVGDYHLAMGIVRGEIEYRGPVRKLLRVIPIVRRLTHQFSEMVREEGIAEELIEREGIEVGSGPEEIDRDQLKTKA